MQTLVQFYESCATLRPVQLGAYDNVYSCIGKRRTYCLTI